jgi:hypothetical protein
MITDTFCISSGNEILDCLCYASSPLKCSETDALNKNGPSLFTTNTIVVHRRHRGQASAYDKREERRCPSFQHVSQLLPLHCALATVIIAATTQGGVQYGTHVYSTGDDNKKQTTAIPRCSYLESKSKIQTLLHRLQCLFHELGTCMCRQRKKSFNLRPYLPKYSSQLSKYYSVCVFWRATPPRD